MWRRAIPVFFLCGLAVLLGLASRNVPANPPVDGLPAVGGAALARAEQEVEPAPKPLKPATSQVVAVTVYPNSALVTREVDVPEGKGTIELVVTPLPPATINSSLYTEGTDGIRVLMTRFRSRPILEDTRADVRKLQEELKQLQLTREQLEADVKAMSANMQMLTKLEGFTTASTTHAAEKGALNSQAAIELSKYIMERRIEKAKEQVGIEQQIQLNRTKAEFATRKLADLTAVTPRTERDAVIVVEKADGAPGKVRLNYLVEAAAWRPQYKLRSAKAAKEPIQLEYLAAVMQQTGEDWPQVKMVLSTAQPMLNAAPPELQVLKVAVVPAGSAAAVASRPNTMELEDQVKSLRSKAQRDINEKKQSSGSGLFNTAAALDQSFELLNPEAAMKRGCSLAVREGPSVTYHLNPKLTVPSRHDEQVLEVARIDLTPDYYYKAVPLLSSHVYRLADLTNKSNYVLLPGEATMYVGTDFVGRMDLPLVAIGETFTAGFGVDPQLQVQRQMIDKARTTQGGNQALRYDYRILVSSYKADKVKLQVWDRLPHAETDAVGVSLLKASPEISKDPLYVREQRPNNLLRWDVMVDPAMTGEKALAITYEFRLELDRQMTISSFQTAGVFAPTPAAPVHRAVIATLTSAEQAKIKAEMAKLSTDDRKIAEAQLMCAIDLDSPLGTMGPILKVMVRNQPVFVCCRGCKAEAEAHPDETLATVQRLMGRVPGKK